MVFSLPSYRRLSDADLHRLRNNSEQQTSTRLTRILFNILLLVGLWGLPLYLRSFVSSKPFDTIDPHEAIIGRWQDVDHSSYVLEFTRDGAFHLSRDGIVKRTAHYRFNERGDVVLYEIKPPLIIDHHEGADAQCRYRFRFTRDGLSVTDQGWEFEEIWRGPEPRPAGLPFIIVGKDFKREQ
jgi:hypothetical protein